MDTAMEKKKPYVFDKRTHKAIVSAEVVLWPKAITRLLGTLITECNNYERIDSDNFYNIGSILESKDPKFQIIIKTDAGVVGGLTIKTEPKEVSIGDDFQGYALIDLRTAIAEAMRYALIDLRTAIAEAMRGDITGLVLETLQQKWKRELTLEDAENITFHLNKLIQILK